MRADHRRTAPGTGSRGLALFLAVPLLVLAAVSIGTAVFSERLARTNALAEAEQSAVRLTRYLVAPVLEEALNGVPGRWEDLDHRVQNRLADRSITTVLVWEAPRDVLYASDVQGIGSHLAPTPELQSAAAGTLVADVDYRPPPGRSGASSGPLVEVYVPLHVSGHSLSVVMFFGYRTIERETALLRGQIIPVAIGGLVVLQLVQVPIGVSLFRRVRREDAGRADLLARSLTASERERRSIAADVHDGPIQDLAGVAYALEALRPSVPAGERSALDALSACVRDTVAWLRRMMVELYPPDLGPAALATALEELAASVRSQTVDVEADVEPVPEILPAVAAVVYRTAKQALEDAAARPGPRRVWLRYHPASVWDEPAVRLQIGDTADDGDDADPAAGDETDLEEFGPADDGPIDSAGDFTLLRAQVAELGGTLVVVRQPGRGAVVTAMVPLTG